MCRFGGLFGLFITESRVQRTSRIPFSVTDFVTWLLPQSFVFHWGTEKDPNLPRRKTLTTVWGVKGTRFPQILLAVRGRESPPDVSRNLKVPSPQEEGEEFQTPHNTRSTGSLVRVCRFCYVSLIKVHCFDRERLSEWWVLFGVEINERRVRSGFYFLSD